MKAMILSVMSLCTVVCPLAADNASPSQSQEQNTYVRYGENREDSFENREDRSGDRGNENREENLENRQGNWQNREENRGENWQNR